MRNEGGKESTLIQLLVEQTAGGYQGYSGSPVIAQAAGGVLGVLVEQGRWRTRAELGKKPPVGNWLFAAPLEGVLAEFGIAGVPVARSVRDIPLPVSYEVRRPDLLNQVLDALTGASADGPLVGLAGMGGSGKSVLAAAAARDPKVREAFPDGQFWLELGPDPPLLQLQASLAAALGDGSPITDVPQGRAWLSRLLAERRCLVVLDNVWDQAHVSAFAEPGPPCRVLVTTRDAATVPRATAIQVGEFDPGAAMRLLAEWAVTNTDLLPEDEATQVAQVAQVAQECGYLPLALAVCGALVKAGTHGWGQLLDLLQNADLDALPIRIEDYPHPSLAVALGASIDTLPPDVRDQYLRLAVFNGQGPVPVAAVQVLWGMDQQHTTALIEGLARKSLVRNEDGRVGLHDLQMDYLVRCAATNLSALHDKLLAAYSKECHGGWASGPDDGYFRQHLAHHLQHAGRTPELKALLWDLDWMNAKLVTGDIPGLLADYGSLYLYSEPAVRAVADALRLSAHVLADDPGQLSSQLTGRLSGQHDLRLRDLLQRARHWPANPWLCPLTASLTPPFGPLLRTLAGHHGEVLAVAVSAGGGRVVSGGADGTVRVWDLASGAPLYTLTGHDSGVAAVAVTADGRRAVSCGTDGTVQLRNPVTGELQHTPYRLPYHGKVAAVAVTADAHRAVSGGVDGTVQVWNPVTGTPRHTRYQLTHHGRVAAVAISADGGRAVSGGRDGTVRVWNLATGTRPYALTGHDRSVAAVAITADGRRAVSGGDNGTVQVWDLASGAPQHAVSGHDGGVAAVAVTADGRRAVSGGRDGTVRVWDFATGALRHTFPHVGGVAAVAVSADGRRAVSSGPDGTVRVWNLATGTPQHTFPHVGSVAAVAMSADGRHAVCGGGNGIVRVWDLTSGTPQHTQIGYHRRLKVVTVSADGSSVVSGGLGVPVRAWDLTSGTPAAPRKQRLWHWFARHHWRDMLSLSISADGRSVVSGGDDGMVRVWDLTSGTPQPTRIGYHPRLTVVAVSADGRSAVSGGQDGTVRVWDLEERMEVAYFISDSRITALAAAQSGTRVIAGTSTGPVHLLELCGYEHASGQPPAQESRP